VQVPSSQEKDYSAGLNIKNTANRNCKWPKFR